MLLAKKLVRELWSQKGQALAVLSVTSLGVMLFVSSAGAYVDLDESYRATRTELALADLHLDVRTVSSEDVARLRASPAVGAAEARVQAELPVDVGRDGAHARLALRVLSLPDAREPALDKLLLASGRLPEAPDEIVVEKHLAEHHHLREGDRVTVEAAGTKRELRVAGVAVSAEYLWVSRDSHDVMPSADAFGVGWMRRSSLRALAQGVLGDVPPADRHTRTDLAAAASTSAGNQLLLERAPGQSDQAALAAAKATLGDDAILGSVPEDELPGVRLLQMDVDGYKGMAAFFPLFFLGVGAFIVASVLGRIVDAQRAVIGTFAALGVGRARILGHYLGYALTLGATGSVLGAVAGFALAPALTHEYAGELGIPFVEVALHGDLAAIGIAIGAGVALLAGLIPALGASRLAPAEAMRPPRPTTNRLAKIARRFGGAPLPLRMAVRDVLGRPLRSLGTALGVAAALVLVLTTSAMLDSMEQTFTTIFDDARRYDLRVDLERPELESDARARLATTDGVLETEGLIVIPARVAHDGKTENVELDGVGDDAKLFRALDVDGRPVALRAGGVVLTRALAKSLDASVGDTVTLSVPFASGEQTLEVVGFADAALGDTAFARKDEIADVFELPGRVTAVAMTVRPDALQTARAALAETSGVAHIEDVASLRAQMKSMMGLGLVMLGTMLAFSVVLASAILFNTATLGILERRRELATMRALGRTLRELALGLTLEHALLCLVGLGLGLPLAIVSIQQVLALYSTDLFTFAFVLSPTTVAVAFVGIALVLLVAQWPALRAVSRMSLADAVRTRE